MGSHLGNWCALYLPPQCGGNWRAPSTRKPTNENMKIETTKELILTIMSA